ncbi:transcription factor C2H2 [Fusarium globosum]|uniref:Transcription factor C2H2 n=1 Tax=Fusarium globosum TaxID=78864 RepID=A0A8H5YM17_9HYPO|nr:transcription factor C2H2 [Fusarium globosum]
MAMGLCDSCRAFDIQAFDPIKGRVRGYKLLSVIAAAESGCQFCSMLFTARFSPALKKEGVIANLLHWMQWIYLQPDDEWKQRLDTPYQQDYTTTSNLGSPLGLTRLWASSSSPAYHILYRSTPLSPFQVLADEESPAAISGDVTGRLLSSKTSSDDHVRVLSRWLQQCQESHEECRVSLSGSPLLNPEVTDLPNRCIEVSRNSDGTRGLRLKETGGRRGKYITLTHRWIQPDTANASTVQINYSDRLQGKALDHLPAHFEDAFDLALKMNIPFLWIDSLCIIQDSQQDWMIEASQMAKYYQNSFFTVAGFGVTRDTGLFATTDQDLGPNLVRLPYRDRQGDQKGYFFVCHVDHSEVKGQYDREIAQSDLLSRGWIFQEWILSRRVISYTRTACFYQCQRTSPRTTTSNDVNLSILNDKHADISLKNHFRLDSLKEDESIFQKWRFAVHTYSSLHLTNAGQDRLSALAGISQEFATVINRLMDQKDHWGSFYLSGLWAGDIVAGLLWEMDGSCSDKRLSGIPTWSWASVVKPIVWQHDHRKISSGLMAQTKGLCKFLGAKKTSMREQMSTFEYDLTRDADLKGQVIPVEQFVVPQFNTLVMQGKLLRVRISGLFDSDSDLDIAGTLSGYEIDHKHNLHAGFTTVPETRTREYWRKISLSQFPEILCGWASIDDLVASSEPILQDVVAFPLTKATVNFPGFGLGYCWYSYQTYSVLLLRCIADGSSCFERIGVGRIFGPQTEDQLKSAIETTFWLV